MREKFDEILEISNQSEVFLQTLPQDSIQMAYKGFFIDEITENLGRLGRSVESNSLREEFRKEKNEFDRKESDTKKQNFLKAMNDAAATPTTRSLFSALVSTRSALLSLFSKRT